MEFVEFPGVVEFVEFPGSLTIDHDSRQQQRLLLASIAPAILLASIARLLARS